MKRLPHGWFPAPRCDSRTGAAHLRRGSPCQDACGLWMFADAAGDPIQVLVVSDGHGGSRYERSDVGSRLACEVALRTVERTLRSRRTGQAGSESEWRQWLAETLPQAIVEAWLEEVKRHWQAQGCGLAGAPEATPETAALTAAFSPTPYGATLGLLVLTPSWWGHTGLGDWDLVRLEASGAGRLISEEAEAGGGGEATYSLCMQGAARYFAARSGLQPLAPEDPPFALLLSTDGIRKSCGTDADYLTLAQYLAELSGAPSKGEPAELSSALDHISSQGSGDDVSVAIGRWGDLAPRPGRVSRRGRSQPLVVQPPPPVGVPASEAAAQLSAGSSPPARADAVDPLPSAHGGRRRQARHPLWSLLLLGGGLLALVAGAGVLLAWRQSWPPFAEREPAVNELTALQQGDLQRQADQLCGRGPSGMGAKPEEGTGGNAPARLTPGSSAGGRNGGGNESPHAVLPPLQDPARPGMATPVAPSGGEVAQGPGNGQEPARSAPSVEPSATVTALQASIRGNLASRRRIFRALLAGDESELQRLLNASATDPLSALIAWSRLDPSLALGLTPPGHAGPSSAGQRGIRWPRIPAADRRPAASQVILCPQLTEELRRQWALSNPVEQPAGQGASGSWPPGTGSPGPGAAGTSNSKAGPTPGMGRLDRSALQPKDKPRAASSLAASSGPGRQDSGDFQKQQLR